MSERLRWNAGGWFGGQVGATAWILVSGILTAGRDLTTGMVVVQLFVIPNVIGVVLWLSRKFSCYASTQILIGVAGVCGLAAVYILERAHAWSYIQTGGQVSAQSACWLIALIVSGLLLMCYLRFGRGSRCSEA